MLEPNLSSARARVSAPPARAIPMTVFSQLRPCRALLQEWILRLTRLTKGDDIRALSFIHFVRFTKLRRVPDGSRRGQRLRHPILLFESNYNGSFANYIDTFSEQIPGYMRLFWQMSYGFPGPKPCTPFKAYIEANEFEVNHYYRAYPHASTTMIVSALALDPLHRDFHAQARQLTPDEFRRAYDAFVADHQAQL